LEIDAELKGMKYFNDQPIIPNHDAGSKENPIMVNIINPLLLIFAEKLVDMSIVEGAFLHAMAWCRI
jgi:hypothetical protein